MTKYSWSKGAASATARLHGLKRKWIWTDSFKKLKRGNVLIATVEDRKTLLETQRNDAYESRKRAIGPLSFMQFNSEFPQFCQDFTCAPPIYLLM